MESQQFECPSSGLGARGYVKLAIRNIIASLTATFLLILFVFKGEIPISWGLFLDPAIQMTFLMVMGIIFLSNLLAALAISLD